MRDVMASSKVWCDDNDDNGDGLRTCHMFVNAFALYVVEGIAERR